MTDLPKLDLRALQDAVASLSDGLDVVSDPDWFNQQTEKVRNTLISGVIKNFEFVYEISIKMVKRQIELDAASPSEVDESNFREVLRVAGLTEQDGAKRISYYADLCGSMEEWITSTGDEIYVQGHFFDQNGFRKEPYIIGILRRAKQTRKLDEVIWSGLNLQTGVDIFAAAKAKSASPAPGGSSKTH